LAIGCTVIPQARVDAFQERSYDLPGSLDVHLLLDAAKESFVRVFQVQPIVIEGGVSAPLPAEPPPLWFKERTVQLAHLSRIQIGEVDCPSSVGSLTVLMASNEEEGHLRMYSSCIQLSARGYRVHFAETDARVKESSLLPTVAHDEIPVSDRVSELGTRFAERIGPAAQFQLSSEQEDSPLQAESPTLSEDSVDDASRMNSTGDSAQQPHGLGTPLICLAPRDATAPIRLHPDDSAVVGLLRTGSLVTAENSPDARYYHVRTDEGLDGWVPRATVRRLACPIG
jgi:hypothetical protein